MKTDVLIIGGGPGGSASSLFLANEGIRSVIVEAEPFPRFHIGESMTGAGGKTIRELGLDDEMRRRGYPVKHGVKVFGQSTRGTWFVPVTGRDDNWNLYDWTTWQVMRSDFDKMLLDTAVERGAELLHGKAIKPLIDDAGVVLGAQVRVADGGLQTIEADVLMDCSGQATWLANHGGVTGPKYLGAYDRQIAFFSHVAGAIRDDGEARDLRRENTLIYYQKKFHWSWFIPVSDEIVSVGVVVPAAYFLEKRESKRDFFQRELRELHPDLARRVQDAQVIEDIHVIPNYSYQVKAFTGKGFICIGDSHRFVDPIFSFGLTVAIREAQFAAPVIRAYLNGENRDKANPFAGYQLKCEQGIDVLEDMVDCFWENPLAFALFVHQRYTNYMTDIFAGRIYPHERQPSVGMDAIRKLLKREGERQRSYETEDLYSIPIGSRYHPERAPLWDAAGSEVETTETWLGPR